MRNIANPLVLSLGIALGVILGIPLEIEAQVNKKKVLREASGTYKGKRSGGTAVLVNGGNTTTVVPPTYTGKFKYPVSKPLPVVRLKSSQLPGNGTAFYKGRRTKGQVKRNGRLIVYASRGTGNEDDGFGPYTNAVTKGSISKKGRKWRTNLKLSAFQDQGGGNTKTVRGLTVRATH